MTTEALQRVIDLLPSTQLADLDLVEQLAAAATKRAEELEGQRADSAKSSKRDHLLQATGEGVKRGAASGGEVAIEDVRRNEL